MRLRSAFSLVELSIVLVILGLLVGGILAGQSLIRASELRAVAAEFQRYQTATSAFRDKYMAIPGDMANATLIWGKDAANCNSHTGSAGTPGTCNGNGNGMLAVASAANANGEMFEFWQQLMLAGLIEGTYTGNSGPAGNMDTVPGTNSPLSKLNGAGWGAQGIGYDGNGVIYEMHYGNALIVGKTVSGSTPYNGALRPEEAWNIDKKIDDGMPGTGQAIAASWSGCANSTTRTDYTGTYRLNLTTLVCSFYFARVF